MSCHLSIFVMTFEISYKRRACRQLMGVHIRMCITYSCNKRKLELWKYFIFLLVGHWVMSMQTIQELVRCTCLNSTLPTALVTIIIFDQKKNYPTIRFECFYNPKPACQFLTHFRCQIYLNIFTSHFSGQG